MNRGGLILKILDFVGDKAVDVYDMLEINLFPSQPFSFSRPGYEFARRSRLREDQKWARVERRESKRRLQKYISKLKSDGLLNKTDSDQIMLTIKGLAKLKKLKLKLPEKDFKADKSPKITIISFDIPEKFRRERNWFREILKRLEFKMLHKSTWMGQKRIPEKLIRALEGLKILEYIKIFEVSKTGTIKELN